MRFPRAFALLSLASVALGGCGGRGDGADEPAIAAAGTGIPVGAPNATGVSFKGPVAFNEPAGPSKSGPPKLPPLPPEPSEVDEEASPDAGAPAVPTATANPGPHPPTKSKKGGGIHL